jgi:hypothetical protein
MPVPLVQGIRTGQGEAKGDGMSLPFGLEIIAGPSVAHFAEEQDSGVQYRTACGRTIVSQNVRDLAEHHTPCIVCMEAVEKMLDEMCEQTGMVRLTDGYAIGRLR